MKTLFLLFITLGLFLSINPMGVFESNRDEDHGECEYCKSFESYESFELDAGTPADDIDGETYEMNCNECPNYPN